MWKTENEEIRAAFFKKAADLAVLHQLQHPNYEYKPRKDIKRRAARIPESERKTKEEKMEQNVSLFQQYLKNEESKASH